METQVNPSDQAAPASQSRTSGSESQGGKAFQLIDQTQKFGAKIWTAVFDLPGEKVNKFDERVMKEFEEMIPKLEELASQGKIDALVVQSGKKKNFIAGADIKLIQAAKTADEAKQLAGHGQGLLNRWEDLPFPRVVAINGTCLGGGCEFSLASTAIVMSDDRAAKIGLPEVMLGVIPGMGGCVRMPTKIGIAQALPLILTGKQLDGKRAFKAGLADACLPKEDFEEYAHKWVVKNLKALQAGKRLAREPKLGGMGGVAGKVLESTPFGRSMIFKKAKEGVLKQTKGQYPAPLEAIAVIQETGTGFGIKWRGTQRDRVMDREAKGFGKCAATDVSKNLIRLFFLTEAVKKSNGLTPHRDLKLNPVEQTAVLGAGIMGGGIAQLFAAKEYPVRMKDITHEALEIGIRAAEKLFKKQLKRRRLNKREYLQKLNHISPVLDYQGFKSSDVVVEAIVENLKIKQDVLKDLENHVADDCVIASNTSSLPITEMQSVLSKPERFVGMHFFNPVHRMPLIEVIRGEKTSDEAVATIFELSKKLGKTPIVVKDSYGFLVNRLLVPYMNEAAYLLLDGVGIQKVDKALKKFGMPMGH